MNPDRKISVNGARGLAKSIAGAAAYWSGAARCYEIVARPEGAIVLMYHSVAEDDDGRFVDPPNRIAPKAFAAQMQFLKRHRQVVSLSALVDALATGRTPPAGTVAITIDDGYRDTFSVAAPILDALDLPATVYLATGYVERAESQWADVVHWCFRYRTSAPRQLSWAGGKLPFGTPVERSVAIRAIHKVLLEARYAQRTLLLQQLEAELRPVGRMPRLTMNWDEARALLHRYPRIELGGHTRDHVDLRVHFDLEAQREIASCGADLRRELGVEPRHFCYPYGRWCAATREMVGAAGWTSAVAGGQARIDAATDRFLIPRIDAPRTMTELRFKTGGAFPGILSWMRRPFGQAVSA